MSHPSCIKMPTNAKELPIVPKTFSCDGDNRDQLCTRSDLTSIADEVFGINKWSHSITKQTLDFVKCIEGRYYVGCSAFIRVQLADGIFHEDMGYSNFNAQDEGLAIFTARTDSITNALRNTLLCFGGGMAKKIKDLIKSKTDTNLMISTIGEPKKIVTLPKTNIKMIPNAHSTPQRSPIRSPIAETSAANGNNNQEMLTFIKNDQRLAATKTDGNKIMKLETSPTNINERMIRSPTFPKQLEDGAKVNKPGLSEEEEKRLERKRRQAQKQEEFRKFMKEKESVEKPNARF